MADTRRYELDPFDRIDVSNGLEVIVTRGEPASVSAEALRPGALDKLDLRVADGVLRASRRSNLLTMIAGTGLFFPAYVRRDVRLVIVAPNLVAVSAATNALMRVDALVGPSIEITCVRSASIDVEYLRAETLRLTSSSAGRVGIAGVCDRLDASFSSGSRISAMQLSCTDVFVAGSNGAFADVNAIGAVSGTLSNGTAAHFYGRPASIDVKATSGSSLTVA